VLSASPPRRAAAESGSTGSIASRPSADGQCLDEPQPEAGQRPACQAGRHQQRSRAELKTLPGIGDAEADRIIKGRPYLSKAELSPGTLMPEGVYVALKKQIIAKQPSNKPATKK